MKTDLQGKREFTALLIDSAALMDKWSIDVKKVVLLLHHSQHKINVTVTHLQLFNYFKQLGVLI